MKTPSVFHPFLFALYPILFLYSFNISQIPTAQIVAPITITLIITILLWFGLTFILKDKKKAGLLLFLFLLLFFTYGHFYKALTEANIQLGQHQYLLPIWGMSLITGAYFTIRTRSNLHHTTMILNVVTAFLVISFLIKILPYELNRIAVKKEVRQARQALHSDINISNIEASGPEPLPDIYYLVFDRYANPIILEEFFDYDNSQFVNYLTEKGFFVALESQTNYPNTFLSLASSLNMEHIDYLRVIKESDDTTVVYDMLQDYPIWRFLKQRGYTFIHFGDWWDPTRVNRFAAMNYNYNPLGSNGFLILLLNTTAVAPAIETFLGDELTRIRHKMLYKFENLATIPDIEGPKFVFAHMLIPHNPYIFGPNGEPLTAADTAKRSEVENYTNQLTFANKQIEIVIDQILSKSSSPPIIIIQSDEGPMITPDFLAKNFINNGDWSQISQEELKTHIKIFNAYHLPNFDQSQFYPSITPVNSFRLIFNHYFDTDFELLEDKSYISEGPSRPYNFVETPNIVQ
jgi:hypothetical protein